MEEFKIGYREIYPNLDEAEVNERAEHDFSIVDTSKDKKISFDEWCAGTIDLDAHFYESNI